MRKCYKCGREIENGEPFFSTIQPLLNLCGGFGAAPIVETYLCCVECVVKSLYPGEVHPFQKHIIDIVSSGKKVSIAGGKHAGKTHLQKILQAKMLIESNAISFPEPDASVKDFKCLMDKVDGLLGLSHAPTAYPHSDRRHPVDRFDDLTARGFKLNLITGKYYMP